MAMATPTAASPPRVAGFYALILLSAFCVDQISSSTGRKSRYEVHTFGAKEPKDVLLYSKVVKRKQLPQKRWPDVVTFPPLGHSSKSTIHCVEVQVPRRRFMRSEVRVAAGGPGLSYVSVAIGGWRAITMDYIVNVYGLVGQGEQPCCSTPAVADGLDDTEETDETDEAEEASTATQRPQGIPQGRPIRPRKPPGRRGDDDDDRDDLKDDDEQGVDERLFHRVSTSRWSSSASRWSASSQQPYPYTRAAGVSSWWG